ncbi:hypothetical protein [Sphingobacterium detergens]|uniref:UbiA prenyltransferase family protein n=1 Tax=Sphingobacterium detergens TaxID=1145106 RepID=A0A420AXR1_SPHD1|nr:hypothetical protein [Sphingobacterium detergens]RKE49272.1 hypothetical protein DFQ12_3383 [Sphingobacterium detergens]
MLFLRKIFYISIYTNILIALAAMAQCALTYIIFERPINWSIVLVEGTATLLLYNFSLWWSKPQNPKESKFARTRWIFNHEWVMWLNNVITLIILGYCLLHIHIYSFLFLGFIGILSLLYGMPLFTFHDRKVGLRQVPGAKIFHIALVWVCSSVVLPYVELLNIGDRIDSWVLVALCVLKFIFLIICTLPFDIRDIQQDSYYHLRTLPNMLGEQKAKRLTYTLLLLHSLLILIAPYLLWIKLGLILTNILIYALLKLAVFKTKDHYHYAYLLDGSLVLQFLIVVLFSIY